MHYMFCDLICKTIFYDYSFLIEVNNYCPMFLTVLEEEQHTCVVLFEGF
jgi:hypothetical protein